jgi:hypothetical protein
LAKVKHLLVAKSKRLHSMGVDGLGLYAYDPDVEMPLKKDENGIPIATRHVVFREGQAIGMYGGEKLTKKQFDDRMGDPDDYETASYAEDGGKGFILDGLAAASAVSYANESLDVAKLMSQSKNQRDFVSRYNAAADADSRVNALTKGGNARMYATKAIRQGQEILWNYTAGYWDREGMKRYITGSGW